MSDRRSRQKEQRAAKKAAEKKKEARKELRKRLTTALGFGAVVVGLLVISGFFGSEGLSSAYQQFRNQPTACGSEPPPPFEPVQYEQPATQDDLDGATAATATINTSCGSIEITLDLQNRQTLESFVFLARSGFYDGQVFHRILAGFDIQGGDPAADGSGGPGYRVPDEFPPSDYVYRDLDVFMANVGRGTTGSQIRIALQDLTSLNPSFNLLGSVTSGHEIVDRIAAIETALSPGTREESLPLETVYIESITVVVTRP